MNSDNVLIWENYVNAVLVEEGIGQKLAVGLGLLLGITIGQIAPTSNTAMQARNSIASFLQGGPTVQQSLANIQQIFKDKYAVTNMDWLKPYISQLNASDENHKAIIQLISNVIAKDPKIGASVTTLSDQDRSDAITASNKLRELVFAQLKVKEGDPRSLSEIMKDLNGIHQNQ